MYKYISETYNVKLNGVESMISRCQKPGMKDVPKDAGKSAVSGSN